MRMPGGNLDDDARRAPLMRMPGEMTVREDARSVSD